MRRVWAFGRAAAHGGVTGDAVAGEVLVLEVWPCTTCAWA